VAPPKLYLPGPFVAVGYPPTLATYLLRVRASISAQARTRAGRITPYPIPETRRHRFERLSRRHLRLTRLPGVAFDDGTKSKGALGPLTNATSAARKTRLTQSVLPSSFCSKAWYLPDMLQNTTATTSTPTKSSLRWARQMWLRVVFWTSLSAPLIGNDNIHWRTATWGMT